MMEEYKLYLKANKIQLLVTYLIMLVLSIFSGKIYSFVEAITIYGIISAIYSNSKSNTRILVFGLTNGVIFSILNIAVLSTINKLNMILLLVSLLKGIVILSVFTLILRKTGIARLKQIITFAILFIFISLYN